jgi:hypothetical protein
VEPAGRGDVRLTEPEALGALRDDHPARYRSAHTRALQRLRMARAFRSAGRSSSRRSTTTAASSGRAHDRTAVKAGTYAFNAFLQRHHGAQAGRETSAGGSGARLARRHHRHDSRRRSAWNAGAAELCGTGGGRWPNLILSRPAGPPPGLRLLSRAFANAGSRTTDDTGERTAASCGVLTVSRCATRGARSSARR